MRARTTEADTPFLWAASAGQALAPVIVGDQYPPEQLIPVYNCGDAIAQFTVDEYALQDVTIVFPPFRCMSAYSSSGF